MPSNTTLMSSTGTTTGRPRRPFRPTRRPFNQETAIRKHIIFNKKMHSPNVPPVAMFSNRTDINITIFIKGVSQIDEVPHQLFLRTTACMVCSEWIDRSWKECTSRCQLEETIGKSLNYYFIHVTGRRGTTSRWCGEWKLSRKSRWSRLSTGKCGLQDCYTIVCMDHFFR